MSVIRNTYYVMWCYIGNSRHKAYFVNAQNLSTNIEQAYKFKTFKAAEAANDLVKATRWGIEEVRTIQRTVTAYGTNDADKKGD